MASRRAIGDKTVDCYADTLKDTSPPIETGLSAEVLGGPRHLDLMVWMRKLGRHDPTRHRRLCAIAWELVRENEERKVIPN
jgi:hypothetical protein